MYTNMRGVYFTLYNIGMGYKAIKSPQQCLALLQHHEGCPGSLKNNKNSFDFKQYLIVWNTHKCMYNVFGHQLYLWGILGYQYKIGWLGIGTVYFAEEWSYTINTLCPHAYSPYNSFLIFNLPLKYLSVLRHI